MRIDTAPTSRAKVPLRRSQAERRADTRGKLLDATIACLVDNGYGGTTTTLVCARAGVSQGALFKHFDTKAALVAAATEHLFASLIADYQRTFARLARQTDKVEAAIAGLRAIFAQPRLHATFELYLAARTDAELAASLIPVSERHRDNLLAQAQALFPEAAAAHPRFADVLGLVIVAIQGATLGDFALQDARRTRDLLEYLTTIVRRELAAAGHSGS